MIRLKYITFWLWWALLFITSPVCAESAPTPEFIIHKVELLSAPVDTIKVTAAIRVLKLAKVHKKYTVFCDKKGACVTTIINYKNSIKHTQIFLTNKDENKVKNRPEIETITERPYKAF